MLQWGHNFFVMEIAILAHNLAIHDSFNGAITFSLWKFVANQGHCSKVGIKGFNGAITFSLWKFVANQDCLVGWYNGLQWGHNFFVMEIYDSTR